MWPLLIFTCLCAILEIKKACYYRDVYIPLFFYYYMPYLKKNV